MELEYIRKGMKVFIRRECYHTKSTQGWQRQMNQYKGTNQEVQSIELDHPNPYVRISGWCWDPKDLRSLVIEEDEEEKIIFLDEGKIWL